MEAYRAAFELGADGLEIDIRATKDGVLVCFHDDMTDHLLEAYGDAADYTRDKLVNEGRSTPGQRSRTTLPSTGSGSQTVQECTTASTLIEYG
jgi:glycerophosphoryl diester phosphodiesterase